MRARDIVCSQCNGRETASEYTPHVRDPETIDCPQCAGKRVIAVMVPEPTPPADPRCGACNGSGRVDSGTPHGTCDGPTFVACPECRGTGRRP